MTCKNCGYELKENNKFCPKCGTASQLPLTLAQDPPVQQPSVQPPATPIESSKKKKKSKAAIIIVSVILVIALLLGGAGAALFFLDPFGWFGKTADKDNEKEKEEEFVITQEMLNGYWVAELSADDMVKDMMLSEFGADDIDVVGEVAPLHAYLYFDGSDVYSYSVAEEMLSITVDMYEVVINSLSASEEMQKELGLSEEEIKELLAENIDYKGYTDDLFADTEMHGIFALDKEEECSYETDGDEITVTMNDEVYVFKYTEKEELEVISYESDDDEDFDIYGSYVTETVFTKLTEDELKALEDEFEEVDDEYIEEWLAAKEPKKGNFSFGRVEGQNYENEYLGFGCTLADEWTLFSEEEIAELNGLDFGSVDSQMDEIMKSGLVAFDMYATHESGTDGINVVVEATDISSLGITIEDYLEVTVSQLNSSALADAFPDIKAEIGTATFGGTELPAIYIEGSNDDSIIYELLVAVDCGACVAAITVATFNENTCEDLLSQFYFIK